MTADFVTPLEAMAGRNRLARLLITHAEDCQELSYQSKRDRVGQAGVLMAAVWPNPSEAEKAFEELCDAVHAWHEWDLRADVQGRWWDTFADEAKTREDADSDVMFTLYGCVTGEVACSGCVRRQPTVSLVGARLAGSQDCGICAVRGRDLASAPAGGAAS